MNTHDETHNFIFLTNNTQLFFIHELTSLEHFHVFLSRMNKSHTKTSCLKICKSVGLPLKYEDNINTSLTAADANTQNTAVIQ